MDGFMSSLIMSHCTWDSHTGKPYPAQFLRNRTYVLPTKDLDCTTDMGTVIQLMPLTQNDSAAGFGMQYYYYTC